MGLGEKCKQKRYSRKLTLSMNADNLLYGAYDGSVVGGGGVIRWLKTRLWNYSFQTYFLEGLRTSEPLFTGGVVYFASPLCPYLPDPPESLLPPC